VQGQFCFCNYFALQKKGLAHHLKAQKKGQRMTSLSLTLFIHTGENTLCTKKAIKKLPYWQAWQGSQTGSQGLHGSQGAQVVAQSGAANLALRFRKNPLNGKRGAQPTLQGSQGSQTGSQGSQATTSHGWQATSPQGSQPGAQAILAFKPAKKPPKGRKGR
jgi:hypothetical protein